MPSDPLIIGPIDPLDMTKLLSLKACVTELIDDLRKSGEVPEEVIAATHVNEEELKSEFEKAGFIRIFELDGVQYFSRAQLGALGAMLAEQMRKQQVAAN